MSNKNLIIVVSMIVGAFIFLGVGCLLGIYLAQGRVESQQEKLTKAENLFGLLGSSKIIPSIFAIGNVTKISGRNITLNNGAENVEIYIPNNVKIYSSVALTKNTFESIKVGDYLRIQIKITNSGEIEGSSITIIPILKSATE